MKNEQDGNQFIAERLRELANMVESSSFDERDTEKLRRAHNDVLDAGFKSVRVEMNPTYFEKYLDWIDSQNRLFVPSITSYGTRIHVGGVEAISNEQVSWNDKVHWVIKPKRY